MKNKIGSDKLNIDKKLLIEKTKNNVDYELIKLNQSANIVSSDFKIK